MSGNTEPSIKFAPMPMSALLAQLMPIEKPEIQSPDSSYSSVDESESFSETLAKDPIPSQVKPTSKLSTQTSTPKVSQPSFKEFISEKKVIQNDKNKENISNQSMSNNWTYQSKENQIRSQQNSIKHPVINQHQHSEVQRRPLVPQNIPNVRVMDPPKRTPEVIKYPSSQQKGKAATPKIKSGIRRFTPGSGRRSNKKTPLKPLQSNKESVRSCKFICF